jgi:hypothetical protein
MVNQGTRITKRMGHRFDTRSRLAPSRVISGANVQAVIVNKYQLDHCALIIVQLNDVVERVAIL